MSPEYSVCSVFESHPLLLIFFMVAIHCLYYYRALIMLAVLQISSNFALYFAICSSLVPIFLYCVFSYELLKVLLQWKPLKL